ncbi:protein DETOXIFICATION 27-like isoform X1 [Cornus florida]|uniref:protein DETOXIFICATION 27-like isoform X1 n=1 Tax=Cornus florida TaxID=4283 RepID=UPI0028987DEB|nr:protein DETOXIFICATION 27-like isoform X1 [Cornus florida]XP_059636621.1 protein DETOXIFICATION 27-like isoform X1 [Cornus florida]
MREQGNEPLLLSSSEENETGHHQEQSDGGSWIRRTWTETKKIWQIAGPSIFTRLAMFSMTLITQSFAGHLGDLDLAAISIATTVIIAISFGFLLGMASALETLCGQAYGAKQYHMLGIYMQCSWVVLFLGSVLLLPLFVFATPILKLTGQSAEIAELSGVVAMWLIPMHLSFMFQFTLLRFLQCQLKMAVIAWVSGGALAVHVFVSWLFVYWLRVGIVGTALTLDFSWWVSVLGLFGYIVCGGCPHSWTGFSNQAFVGLWEFLKLSVASGIMLSLENFYYRVLIIVSGMMMNNTEVAVNALSICIAIYGWESMIPLGFFAATGVRVANELGAGNAKAAKFATIMSVLTSLVVGIFCWSMIMAFPDKLAMIFTSSTSVIAMVDELAVLLALTILINCIQPVLSGKRTKRCPILQAKCKCNNIIIRPFAISSGVAVGCGWQGLAACINMGSYYIIGVPLGLILGCLLPFGIKGIWAGMIGGTVVQTSILAIIIISCKWENEAQKARFHMANQALPSY